MIAGERKEIQNRLKAYSHPLRWAVFTLLTERIASPAEIAEDLGLEDRKWVSEIDYHTKQLVKYECAELVEEESGRPSSLKRYKATERAMIETAEWERFKEESPALAQLFLGKFMQVQLDDYLLALREGTIGDDEKFHMSRTRRILDAQGLEERMESAERYRDEGAEIELRSARRRSVGGADAIHVSDSVALFKVPRRRIS